LDELVWRGTEGNLSELITSDKPAETTAYHGQQPGEADEAVTVQNYCDGLMGEDTRCTAKGWISFGVQLTAPTDTLSMSKGSSPRIGAANTAFGPGASGESLARPSAEKSYLS
jgi:hypothetical protein